MGKKVVKKVLPFFICILLITISTPIIKSTDVNNSGENTAVPSINVQILNQFSLFSLYFTVTNTGTTTLTNVRYEGMTVSGYVIYNSAPKVLITELEPGDTIVALSDRFVGIGIFVAKITVTTNSGVNATDYANGLVFGALNFVP